MINTSQKKFCGEVKILMPKFKEKNLEECSKKLLRKMKKYNVQNIVLNNELNENIKFKNTLIESKKNIIIGNRLGKILLPQIINEISKYTKFPSQNMKVILLMNEYSIENIDLIECIAKEVKQLNVVSQNYSKYEKTANKLYQNYGCVVKLYNENVKEFKRENIIINMDFSEKSLQEMILPKNGIVISLNEKINSLRKNFEGIIIRDIDILGDGIKCENFRKLAVCEAKLYRPLRKIKDNERVFFSEKYIINGYIGRNGKITQEDFERVGKNYA